METVIEYSVGEPGSGKSYTRCPHFLIFEFLPYATGDHWSNFPIKIDEMVRAAVARNPKLNALDLHARIKLIPDSVMESWQNEESGPWEFFKDIDLQGAHIAIDECHYYFSKGHSNAFKREWTNWLSMIRHRGATIEFLSQRAGQVAVQVDDLAGVKRVLQPATERMDPFFKVSMGDWLGLISSWTGEEVHLCYAKLMRKNGAYWVKERVKRIDFLLPLFDTYDSYSKAPDSTEKTARPPAKWQVLGRLGYLRYFLARNFEHIVPRVAIAIFMGWVCFGGGGALLLGKVVERFAQYTTATISTVAGRPVGSAGVVAAGGASPGFGFPSSAEAEPIPAPVDGHHRRAAISEELSPPGSPLFRRAGSVSGPGESPTPTPTPALKSNIRMIFKDRIVLEGGQTYGVGEVLPRGRYVGRRIVAIDWKYRRVILDGGEYVWLR